MGQERLSLADLRGAGRPGLADIVRSHVARYRFAAPLARGGAVLDAACGSGYGAEAFAGAAAASYLGVDLNAAVIASAREAFGRTGFAFECQDLVTWRPPEGGFDLAACFETIEHVPLAAAEALIDRLARALRPGGALVVSSPDRDFQNAGRALDQPPLWPYHRFEWTAAEFFGALERRFRSVERLAQRPCGQRPPEGAPDDWFRPVPFGSEPAETLLAVCRDPRPDAPRIELTRGEIAAARCLSVAGGTVFGRLTIVAAERDGFALRLVSDEPLDRVAIRTNTPVLAVTSEHTGDLARVKFRHPREPDEGVTLGYLRLMLPVILLLWPLEAVRTGVPLVWRKLRRWLGR